MIQKFCLAHLSALHFVLSCEVTAWSANNKFTRQPVLCVFSNEGDQLSSAILEIIWSEPTLHFFKSAIMFLLRLVSNFCEFLWGVSKGIGGVCVLY